MTRFGSVAAAGTGGEGGDDDLRAGNDNNPLERSCRRVRLRGILALREPYFEHIYHPRDDKR